MAPYNKEEKPIVIIAYREPGSHLVGLLQDLKLWFKNFVIVGPKNNEDLHVLTNNGCSWVISKSPHIFELWEIGINAKSSDWYILIQDREYLSSVLKKNIIETIKTKPIASNFYTFDRKSFFLS